MTDQIPPSDEVPTLDENWFRKANKYVGKQLIEAGEKDPGETPNKTLRDSKLYALAQKLVLLDFLAPNPVEQLHYEVALTEKYPRTEELGESTRIVIDYSKQNGDSILYQIPDDLRLAGTFDVDHFMNAFLETQTEVGQIPGTEDDKVSQALLQVLQQAVVGLLDTDQIKEETAETIRAGRLFRVSLKALVSVIFDDPTDVIILVKEKKTEDGDAVVSVITGMWSTGVRLAM